MRYQKRIYIHVYRLTITLVIEKPRHFDDYCIDIYTVYIYLCYWSLVLCVHVCFVDRCLSFCTFSWQLCCLFFFDRRILITPLVSSNFSYSKIKINYFSGAKTKRIIPILLDNVRIPLILNFVGIVNFTNPHQREWVWPRVAATIKCPLIPSMEDYLCTIDDLKNLRYNTKAVSHMLFGLGVACQEYNDEDEDEEEKKTKNRWWQYSETCI